MTATARATVLSGTVRSFHAERGLGEIEAASGERYAFHCIEIADGTREIEVGARVTFETLAKFGRYEACTIRPDRS